MCYGLLNNMVMWFGLTNASTIFQHMMNDIVREYMDQLIMVYPDKILFPRFLVKHVDYIHLILTQLRHNGPYPRLEKC